MAVLEGCGVAEEFLGGAEVSAGGLVDGGCETVSELVDGGVDPA